MKNGKKSSTILFLIGCFVFLLLPIRTAKAAPAIMPAAEDNLGIGLISKSELVVTDNGYMRVFYDGAKVGIEYYDNEFQIQSKKSLAMELSLWGGFYAGSDAYYLVEGQNNEAQSDTAEVIRVIRYDMDWNRTGAASITGNPKLFGGVVRYPFDYGCVEMTERDGTLYIVTGHEGYVDPEYRQGHQGFLMIAVEKASMTGQIVSCDLWHSFAQYITCRGSNLYVLEQSEGSRYTKLSKYGAGNQNKQSLNVFEYGGSRSSAWAVSCHASVDGMALSSSHVLCIGTSIDQSKYDSATNETAHNIYLTVTPMSDFTEKATTVKWLTDYSGGGKSFLGVKITKVNDNRFMISWEEDGKEQEIAVDDTLSGSVLHYIFLDGKGNPVSGEYTAAAPISDCQPIVNNGKIVYYASNNNMVNFYSIDAQTGQFGKTCYRVAGENATWDFDGRVFTLSGTGAMSVNTVVKQRNPVSSVSGWSSYPSDDNVWKSIRDKVKKLVIKTGITSIPESAFAFFDSLTEVEIEPGLQSIGKFAFCGCKELSKIKIPRSVTSIGEDFLWTGSCWTNDGSHVVKAEICTPKGSYAAKYARENGIRCNGKYNTASTSILNAKVSGIRKSYAYRGRAWKPETKVKLGGRTLRKGKDYKVSYKNNINTGKAVVKIKGIHNYKGSITKTFRIVPKKAAKLKVKALKAGKIKVSWKKDKQADGYQIQYAKNAKFSKGKKAITIEKQSTASEKIAKLAKGRKYFVRIRAYKIIKNKKYYGAWSKAAKVRCR